MSEPTTELTAESLDLRDRLLPYWRNSAHHINDQVEEQLAAIEAAAASRATEPLRTLIGELANNYHQTGLIRDHHDRTVAGWQVRGIETCSDLLCVEARAALSALPASQGAEAPDEERLFAAVLRGLRARGPFQDEHTRVRAIVDSILAESATPAPASETPEPRCVCGDTEEWHPNGGPCRSLTGNHVYDVWCDCRSFRLPSRPSSATPTGDGNE